MIWKTTTRPVKTGWLPQVTVTEYCLINLFIIKYLRRKSLTSNTSKRNKASSSLSYRRIKNRRIKNTTKHQASNHWHQASKYQITLRTLRKRWLSTVCAGTIFDIILFLTSLFALQKDTRRNERPLHALLCWGDGCLSCESSTRAEMWF